MKVRFFVFLFFVTALVSSCKKTECTDSEKATLKDYKGLDGCTWIIELGNGERLEPVNLEDFVGSPVEGMKIKLSYNIDIEMASICLVGKVAQIICLEKL